MPNKTDTTQNFIPIKEIRDGVVILKDDSMRAILMTSSLNFVLKSEDEQASILFQFQNFVNSLDFSIQIFLESRKLDIRPYLALLESRQKEQNNDLLKVQIKEYIEFIKEITTLTNIMTKIFFIVVPYTAPKISINKSKKIMENTKQTSSEIFEENRIQLEQRVAIVEQGVVRTGIRTARLGTEEIIEVYYKLFNPGEMEKPIKIEE